MAELRSKADYIPELFDVDSLVDDSLTDTFLFSDGLTTLCKLFDDNNYNSYKYSHLSTVQVEKADHKSPFHESDSGLSDISRCSSSPTREGSIMLDELIDNLNNTPFLLTSRMDQDREFTSLLSSEVTRAEITLPTKSIGSEVVAPKILKRQTRSKTGVLKSSTCWTSTSSNIQTRSAAPSRVSQSGNNKISTTNTHNDKTMLSPQFNSGSDEDSEIEVIDNDNENTLTKPKGTVCVTHRGATLPKKASSIKSDASGSNITSIKIVRIKASDNTDTASEVVKAIEDRNRKNADQAKINRQKKKAYIDTLEQEVEEGKQKSAQLEVKICNVEKERDDLKNQVEYLKSVLANQSMLAGLLKNIPNTDGVVLSSSITRKRAAEMDHSYTPKKPCHSMSASTAGICLHVDEGKVSLELCHLCARMSHLEDGSYS